MVEGCGFSFAVDLTFISTTGRVRGEGKPACQPRDNALPECECVCVCVCEREGESALHR